MNSRPVSAVTASAAVLSVALAAASMAPSLTGCAPVADPAPGGAEASAVEEVGAAAQASTTCVTIERGVSGTVADAGLQSGSPNTNYGSVAVTPIGVTGTGGYNYQSALLRFDLGAIPASSAITSATMTLTVYNTAPATLLAQLVVDPWTESTVTPSTLAYPSYAAGGQAATFNVHAGNAAVSFDVSSAVRSWVNGWVANDGLVIDQPSGNNRSFLQLSEHPNAAYRPRLTVCYQASRTAFTRRLDVPDAQDPSIAYSTDDQIATGVASDCGGNAYVAGAGSGTLSFGGPPVSLGGGAGFLARFDGTGAGVWNKVFAGVTPQGVAADCAGNTTVTGTFSGTVNLGGGPITAIGYADAFVARYGASGNYVWGRQFGAAASYAQGTSVALAPSGNVAFSAIIGAPTDFGGGPIAGTAPGGYGAALVELASTGSYVWARAFGDQSTTMSVGVDASGNVAAAGGFATADFGGGPVTAAGYSGVFVARYDASGNYLWSRTYGSAGGGQLASGVAVDPSGNIALTGQVNGGTADFGNGPIASSFLAKLGTSGNTLFSRALPGTNYANVVREDASGNSLVAATTRGGVDFGAGLIADGGLGDGFVAKYDPAGALLWGQTFGWPFGGSPAGIAVDPSGNGLLAGTYGHQYPFDPNLQAYQDQDVFLTKVTP